MSEEWNEDDLPHGVYLEKIPDTLPEGVVLVHNTVKPAQRQGTRGFRFWLQKPADHLEVCSCGWAPQLPEHYRVAGRWGKVTTVGK